MNPKQNEIPTPSDDRDGNWLDKWGCCKVCSGEIPDGHQENCDIYKLEKEIRQYKLQLTELKALPMPLPADPTNPFYIETMEQAKVLKEMATRTGLHQGNQLETIARKLEYMAQAFTCTANFVPIQLKVKKLETELTELRGLADSLCHNLVMECDFESTGAKKSITNYKSFIARHTL